MDRQTVDHYLLMALLGAVLTLAMQYAGLKKKLDQLCDNGSEGGYGFSHIIAKHGEEAAQKVPKILAFGKYFHDEQERDAYTVVLGNEVVSVKRETGNFLVVTSYASDKKATAYLRRGGQIENKAKDDSATF